MEVECIGKDKARAPYRVQLEGQHRYPVTSPKGRPLRALCRGVLYGIPFDGHNVITNRKKLTGVAARRIHVDKDRGHNYPHPFMVWVSGRSAASRREMKRRAAVEPVVGHVNAEHRMDRNYLKGRLGDRIYAVLAAAGYNFSLLLRWLAELLRVIIRALIETAPARNIAEPGTPWPPDWRLIQIARDADQHCRGDQRKRVEWSCESGRFNDGKAMLTLAQRPCQG